MPYSQVADAIVQVQIVGTLHGQRTRNVFHYHKWNGAVTDGKAFLTTFLNWFDQNVGDPIRDCQSWEHVTDWIQAQFIRPDLYRAVNLIKNVAGGVQENSLPSGVAVVVSTYAEAAGRAFQGRRFFPGIPVTHEEDSLLSEDGVTAWGFIPAKLLMEYNEVTTGVKMTPIITDTALGLNTPSFYMKDTILRHTLRYQRRREVGKGE